jgi:hypothetical protein
MRFTALWGVASSRAQVVRCNGVAAKAVIHPWRNCPSLNHRTADKVTRYLDSAKSYGYPCGA